MVKRFMVGAKENSRIKPSYWGDLVLMKRRRQRNVISRPNYRWPTTLFLGAITYFTVGEGVHKCKSTWPKKSLWHRCVTYSLLDQIAVTIKWPNLAVLIIDVQHYLPQLQIDLFLVSGGRFPTKSGNDWGTAKSEDHFASLLIYRRYLVALVSQNNGWVS